MKINSTVFLLVYVELYWMDMMTELEVGSFMEIVNQHDLENNREVVDILD